MPPGVSSRWSASSRVICAQIGAPSPSVRSTRTSKPRRSTRSTVASRAVAVGLVDQLDVVRAHEAPAEPVDRADEAHDEGVGGLLVDLARRADLLDFAVVHDDDAVGDLHRLLLVVRDEDRRHVDLLVQAPQPVAQLLAHPRVERAEGLVQQQHLAARRRARGRAPCAGAGRRRAATGSGRRGRRAARATSSSSTRSLISAFGRLRMRRPNATFSSTVMCLKAA